MTYILLYILLGIVVAYRLDKLAQEYEPSPAGERFIIFLFAMLTWPVWVVIELWDSWKS